MPVKFNRSISEVKVNQNRLAVTSGPLVFCAEEVDNDGLVQRFMLNGSKNIQANSHSVAMGKLNKLKQIHIQGKELKDEQLQDATIVYTPYFAWNNRGDGSMIVWTPTESKKKAMRNLFRSDVSPNSLQTDRRARYPFPKISRFIFSGLV